MVEYHGLVFWLVEDIVVVLNCRLSSRQASIKFLQYYFVFRHEYYRCSCIILQYYIVVYIWYNKKVPIQTLVGKAQTTPG